MRMPPLLRTSRSGAVMLALALAATCGGPSATGAPAAAEPMRLRGVPGFDTSRYPGDSTMRAWRTAGAPYRWVGYYLQSPCHRDPSWMGTRGRLAELGWGIAVLYVGQQAWEGAPDIPRDSAQAGPIICSRTLLSAGQGRADADDAIRKAAGDGFPTGTIIYLDLEPMTTIPDSMRVYYRAWAARLLEEGRYRPGVYVHGRNLSDVVADVRSVYADAGAAPASGGPEVPVWLAQPDSAFTVAHAPQEAGAGPVRIWQGRVNFTESWGGIPLRIDANVADRPSPSAP